MGNEAGRAPVKEDRQIRHSTEGGATAPVDARRSAPPRRISSPPVTCPGDRANERRQMALALEQLALAHRPSLAASAKEQMVFRRAPPLPGTMVQARIAVTHTSLVRERH